MFNSVIQNKPAKCYIIVMHYSPLLRELDNMLILSLFPHFLMFPCVCQVYFLVVSFEL
jgi:hypothetical protein